MSRHRLGTSAKADLQNPGQWESPEATSEGLYYLGSSPIRWNAQGARWSTTAGPSGPREEAFGQFRRHGNCRGGIWDERSRPSAADRETSSLLHPDRGIS